MANWEVWLYNAYAGWHIALETNYGEGARRHYDNRLPRLRQGEAVVLVSPEKAIVADSRETQPCEGAGRPPGVA